MKRVQRWIIVLILFLLTVSTGFGQEMVGEEISKRGLESPSALLIGGEAIYLAVQEPSGIVVYNQEWDEMGYVTLPEGFIPNEMIRVGDRIWILDEENDLIVEMDLESLTIMLMLGKEKPIDFSAIFEAKGEVLAFDSKGFAYHCVEELDPLGWMTGMSVYQACIFDDYFLYLGGVDEYGDSGILVKSLEDQKQDHWRLQDNPEETKNVDTVEKIRLLQDGYIYVVYQNSGIMKYDGDGNRYNRFYQETGEVQIFMDIAYDQVNEMYYYIDQKAGVFRLDWPKEEIVYSEIEEELDDSDSTDYEEDWDDWDYWKDWEGEMTWEDWMEWEYTYEWELWRAIDNEDHAKGEPRCAVHTWKGTTTAEVKEDILFTYYRDVDSLVRILVHARDSTILKLRIPISDLIQAQLKGYETLMVDWNGQAFEFALHKWGLAIKDPEVFERQYVEIRIDQGEPVYVDACFVERLDEKTKTVRRENLE